MRFLFVPAGLALALAGCATQDQLRQTEAQQGQAVQALKASAERSDSVIADLRAEIKRAQDTVHGLEVALTDARARTDSAKAQADSALATSREFLANLLAAREEQRRQLDENGVAFTDLKRKAADFELRLQAQQRLIEQGNVALNNAVRRITAVESGMQEAGRRATLLEVQAKAGQETDGGLTRQLATLGKQLEETRSIISSEGMLQMMRQVEDQRRDSAALRGSIEELQKGQADSATQAKNFYIDLDGRIQALKKAQADLVTQNKAADVDLDARIQALSKAQGELGTQNGTAVAALNARIEALGKVHADFAAQQKSAQLDLEARVQELKKAQAELAAQDKNATLDLNARIEALSKTQSELAAQDRSATLDLNTRIEALNKAQAELAAQDKGAAQDLNTRIEALGKAQEELAAQVRSSYQDIDGRIQALKQAQSARAVESKPGSAASSAAQHPATPARPASR